MIEIILILVAIGAYCVGRLHEAKRVLFWKIKWIRSEHELAAIQKREPRECSEIERDE